MVRVGEQDPGDSLRASHTTLVLGTVQQMHGRHTSSRDKKPQAATAQLTRENEATASPV